MALFGRNKTPAEPPQPLTDDSDNDHTDEANDVTEKEEDIKDLLEDVEPGDVTQPDAPKSGPIDNTVTPVSSGPMVIHPHQATPSSDDADDHDASPLLGDAPSDDDTKDDDEESSPLITPHEDITAPEAPEEDEHDENSSTDVKPDDEKPADNVDESSNSSGDESSHVVDDVDREVKDLINRLSNEAEGLDTEINNSEAKIKELQGEIDSHKARKSEIDKKITALNSVVDDNPTK